MNSTRKSNINIDNILYYGVLFVLVGYFSVLPLRNIALRHVFVFSGSILIYLTSIIRIIRIKKTRNTVMKFIIPFFIYFLQLIVSSDLSFDAVYAWLNFLSFFIIMTTSNNSKMTQKQMSMTFKASIIIGCVMILISFTPTAYIFEDGKITGAMVLGMTNPNFAAIMISALINIMVINIGETKYKVFLLGIIMWLVLLLYKTLSRSCLIATIFVIAYIVFLKNWKFPNTIVFFIVLSPICSALLYLSLYRGGYENIQFMGKDLFSGREYIFDKIIYGSKSVFVFLFGNFGEVKFANAHNSSLTIYATLGIVGLLIVFVSFEKFYLKKNSTLVSSISRIAMVCILSFFIESGAETVMFTGVFPGIGFIYIYNVFLSYENEKIETDEYYDKRDQCVL